MTEETSEKLETPSDLTTGYELRSLLSHVADNLPLYDQMSFIFLTCETPQSGIHIMENILKQSDVTTRNTLFYKWLENQSIFKSSNWKMKLAEVLAIIQNYKLLQRLGFTKKESIEHFMAYNYLKTVYISKVHKILYKLCEELNKSECKLLIQMMEGKEDDAQDIYLEYKLLVWSERGIINLNNEEVINLKVLVSNLKSFDLNLVIDIEIIVERVNCQWMRSKFINNSKLECSEYYNISKDVGLCVIINEKNFKHSLPKRWGTDKDSERLIEVFSAFGFNVNLHVDLTFEELVKTLGFYAETIKLTHSIFVLIILSHGSQNIIYTSDSLPVDMNTIEMIFQAEVCPNLIGKPKLFIIQSCQGEKWQSVVGNVAEDIQTDCVSSPVVANGGCLSGPQKGDSMVAWSTVQGFASFRDKYNGSWYVQELCNELWKFGDAADLVEIMTKVNNNLRSKVHNGQFMVPSLLLSLRAKVRFPLLKSDYEKGLRLMLERLLFEKLFREFLACSKFLKTGISLKFQYSE